MQIPGLSGSLASEVDELARQPLKEDRLLLEGLEEYLESARRHLPSGSEQLGLAESIATRALELYQSQTEPASKQLAQAAIEYLLKTDDMIADFEGENGLYDDVEVFNAIAQALGREDLALSL